MTTRRVLLAATLVLAFGIGQRAEAITIQYQATDLADLTPGEDLWAYQYFPSAFPFPADHGFAIFFDYETTAALTNPVAPADWDPLAADPIPATLSDGYYDALALIDDPSVAGIFSVQFVWSGAGSPGSQPFEIYELINGTPVPFEFGDTVPFGADPIPEPSSLLLVAAGAAGLVRRVRHRSRRRPFSSV